MQHSYDNCNNNGIYTKKYVGNRRFLWKKVDSLLLWDILGNIQTLWKSLWSKWSNITNGLFLHMHLAVGYLSCCSHFPLPLFRTRQFTRVWFWSSFLVDCLSCQAPLHSINDTAASHYSLIFNGVEIKIDQIKKSRCKSITQKMKLNTLHTKKSSKRFNTLLKETFWKVLTTMLIFEIFFAPYFE